MLIEKNLIPHEQLHCRWQSQYAYPECFSLLKKATKKNPNQTKPTTNLKTKQKNNPKNNSRKIFWKAAKNTFLLQLKHWKSERSDCIERRNAAIT